MIHSLNRRDMLRIGGLSIFGSSIFGQAGAAPSIRPPKQCIFILLQGGPSHLEFWDPKPDAPSEIRGPFSTIPTALPGVRFGELIHRTAKVADRLAIVRSMTHKFTNHIAGTYVTLTGSNDQRDQDREAAPHDFPGPAAILNHLHNNELPAVPRAVSLPNWLSIPGPSNRMPGQYGGFLGGVHDPILIEGKPHHDDFNPLSLNLPDGLTTGRLKQRLSLMKQLDGKKLQLESELRARYDRLTEGAYELVCDGKIRDAVNLSKEPDRVRDWYGRHHAGQSFLLARRLIEAGVQFVAFNEFNQKWDTHGDLERRYRDIVPPLDQAYGTLIEDLEQRGVLENTLVIKTGEFGRTPVVNNQAGRDHWPNVYSTLLAGGGIRGGQVLGSSDWKGAEVSSRPVSPGDILATMWHTLGVNPTTEIRDSLNRPFPIASGNVVTELF